VKKLTNSMALHGSISYGFSPPAIEEVRTNEGSINLGLQPEKGTNYEVGFRGNTLRGKLNFDLTAFFFKLNETIVQQPSDDRPGTFVFRNAGNTDQKGLELAATWFAIENPGRTIEQVEIQTAYTFHDFTFKNYVKEGEDYSGNALTGVAPNISVTSINVRTSFGIYLLGTYNFTDKIPLNDANEVYADAYHLVSLKAGYQVSFSGNMEMEIFLGMDNVLNQKYSLGNDLNAFGGRYYQPAPKRNYFGGIKFQFNNSGK
jgi:iron complex outermembrane receptor protein